VDTWIGCKLFLILLKWIKLIFHRDLKLVDWHTNKIHWIKCPRNKDDFTVIGMFCPTFQAIRIDPHFSKTINCIDMCYKDWLIVFIAVNSKYTKQFSDKHQNYALLTVKQKIGVKNCQLFKWRDLKWRAF